MEYAPLLDRVTRRFCGILGRELTGIYVHGSIAFGCFHWESSDIDFLAVVQKPPSLEQKEALIRFLLELVPSAPPKGLEMSVVLEEHCRKFRHPTPYELHFSNWHLARFQEDLSGTCAAMRGEDPDLAAHITVVKRVGIAWYGRSAADTFGVVPWNDYLDSITSDVERAREEIALQPVYVTLSLCRVLAAREAGLVLSKEQGAEWGMANLPKPYAGLIREAAECYRTGRVFSTSAYASRADEFAEAMTARIFSQRMG